MKALNILSKMELAIPIQRMSPIEQLKAERKKKIYRKSKMSKEKVWEWGEE